MGGTGSGRWKDHKCKRLIERTIRISIGTLLSKGKLEDETIILNWCNNNGDICAKVGVKVYEGLRMVEIFYELGNRHIAYNVRLDYTQHGFGSKRTWFLCPLCERRVSDLYWVKNYFLCRHCCNLAYSSERRK